MHLASKSLPRRLLLLLGLAATDAAYAQCNYTWPVGFAGGCDGAVHALLVDDHGDLIAGGNFTTAGGVAAARIARWDGAAWQTLGSGTNGAVNTLVRMPNGDVIAGGTFTIAGGVTVRQVARWDGAAWSALGTGVDPLLPFGGSVTSMVVDAGGGLVIGGSFAAVSGVACSNLARWDGATWSPLGAGVNGIVRDIERLPNGDLVVCGTFGSAGGAPAANVARWNGVAWSPLGSGVAAFGLQAVTALANGDVVVGGTFATAGGVPAASLARWNGVAWSAIGAGANGTVSSLQTLENGSVLIGGYFTTVGGVAANRVALWDGASTFTPFGVGCSDAPLAFARQADGRMAVGGGMLTAGGVAVSRIAQVESSCGAATAVAGAGCVGSGGLNELHAVAAPVLGGVFQARATGMPSLALVLVVNGFSSAALPLVAVFPIALPGCTLLANPDNVGVVVPVAGEATSALTVPNVPALLGAVLHHQHVPIEVDLALNFQAISATNSLVLTLGSF